MTKPHQRFERAKVRKRTAEEELRLAAFELAEASAFIREHAHGSVWIEMADRLSKAAEDVSQVADDSERGALQDFHDQD